MKTEIAFWDSSALIPLCLSQKFTVQAAKLRQTYPKMIIWWGTSVEVFSGLARLKRELDARQMENAIGYWDQIYKKARKVEPERELLDVAIRMPERYGLRAMDAFQLAAALIWCGERPRNRAFITADGRLGEAASYAGFNVVTLV